MNFGSLSDRWLRGVTWTWVNDDFRARLPRDLESTVMSIDSRDRYHAKQGRSTARVVLDRPERPLPVYLKRHYRLPFRSRLAALFDPSGKHSPGAAEWAHLERARSMGLAVPEVVAAGERIGPGARLSSFLMVAELNHCEALHELIPKLAQSIEPQAFSRLKRTIVAEMAGAAATLHRAWVFHKDLYLCHFFLDPDSVTAEGGISRLFLIDLHRLAEHRVTADWYRWKDLGQLLFSTYGVSGIDDRDRLRFWKCYRRLVGLKRSGWQAKMVRLRAARYLAHNRAPR